MTARCKDSIIPACGKCHLAQVSVPGEDLQGAKLRAAPRPSQLDQPPGLTAHHREGKAGMRVVAGACAGLLASAKVLPTQAGSSRKLKLLSYQQLDPQTAQKKRGVGAIRAAIDTVHSTSMLTSAWWKRPEGPSGCLPLLLMQRSLATIVMMRRHSSETKHVHVQICNLLKLYVKLVLRLFGAKQVQSAAYCWGRHDDQRTC